MSSITLGRYTPRDTFIHRLDPRLKIISLIILMVAIFISYSTFEMTFLMGGILLIFIILLAFVSGTSFKSLFKSLRAMWFLIVFLLLINILVKPKDAVNIAFSIGSLDIYWESIFQSLKIILRLFLMVSLTMILTTSTKPLDLTYALEWYMKPLKLIKFPTHEVAMTISIALRFIPTLLNEVERIMKAQTSRGVDFKHGKISSRFKAIISLIIPLFISSFQRAEELADSMEARGYNPRAKRTTYHHLKFSFNDLLAFILCSAFMAATIVFSAMNFTIKTPLFVPWLVIGCCLVLLYLFMIGCMNARRYKK